MDKDSDDITFRSVWRRDDPQIVRDVKRLWAAQGIPPALTAQREGDLCAAAYCGEQLAAVSTAGILYYPLMRNKFFAYRCIVDPRFRERDVAWRISAHSFKLLQEWATLNAHERILGLLICVETDKFMAGLRRPVREKFGFTMHFVGYSADNEQVRVVWFDNAMLDNYVAVDAGH